MGLFKRLTILMYFWLTNRVIYKRWETRLRIATQYISNYLINLLHLLKYKAWLKLRESSKESYAKEVLYHILHVIYIY